MLDARPAIYFNVALLEDAYTLLKNSLAPSMESVH